MEIIFLLISIILTLAVIYAIGRASLSHRELINSYKDSEFLGAFHFMIGLIMVIVVFVTLCAFNNSIWHLPYLTQ